MKNNNKVCALLRIKNNKYVSKCEHIFTDKCDVCSFNYDVIVKE